MRRARSVARRSVHGGGKLNTLPVPRKRRLDHQLFQMFEHIAPRRFLAAPPGGDGGHLQVLAQQVAAQAPAGTPCRRAIPPVRCPARWRSRRCPSAPPAPGRGRRASNRRAVPADRRSYRPAAHDHVHRQQAAQGFQEHAIVAHREIAAFHQREAPVARQERMFEIRFVVRTGREQHDARILRSIGHQSRYSASRYASKKRASCRTCALAENRRQRARAHQAILERIADARRRLRAVGDHPPVAIGRTRQIGRVACAGRRRPAARCRSRGAENAGWRTASRAEANGPRISFCGP